MTPTNGFSKFPVLTKEVDYGGLAVPASGIRGGATELSRTVEQSFYHVLKWRPRATDAKGFLAALDNAFEAVVEEGQERWIWNPTIYTSEGDRGIITGAQAVIHRRGKAMLTEIKPLLDQLEPLDPAADEEDIETIRVIVDNHITELVEELGLAGGPRIQRVDQYFESLLGVDVKDEAVPAAESNALRGDLRELRDRFGLSREFVTTVAEEEESTKYLMIYDYITSLRATWKANREYFVGDGAFLGTQIVRLHRALNTLVESVLETRLILDSVFIGPAEQRSAILPSMGDPEVTMTIAELLSWIEEFALEEGPNLIEHAGRDGILALTSTLRKMRELIRGAIRVSAAPPDPENGGGDGNNEPSFRNPRVRRALVELDRVVADVGEYALQIRFKPATGSEVARPDTVRVRFSAIQITPQNVILSAEVHGVVLDDRSYIAELRRAGEAFTQRQAHQAECLEFEIWQPGQILMRCGPCLLIVFGRYGKPFREDLKDLAGKEGRARLVIRPADGGPAVLDYVITADDVPHEEPYSAT